MATKIENRNPHPFSWLITIDGRRRNGAFLVHMESNRNGK